MPAPLLLALILVAALVVTGCGHAKTERFGNGVMPPFDALGRRKLHQLAVFLADSKGRR